MTLNLRAVRVRTLRAIVRKDLKVVSRNKGVLLPLIIIPLLFFVIIPAGFGLGTPAMIELEEDPLEDMRLMLEQMPPAMQAQLAGLDAAQTMIILIIVYTFAPLFLIVPMMVASVIAADSFAGERERKTLEALLYTPATDMELYLAKLLAAWLPAVVIGWVGFLLYGVAANASAWPVMGRLFFPNGMWWVLALWVTPAAAGLGLSVMVLVSSRAQGFQDAYQVGGMVVIPIILLMFGQISGLLFLSTALALGLGALLWVIDVALLWLGVRLFQRGELIARL